MNVGAEQSLSFSRTIAADRQAVWDAWTQPQHMKKWASPEGVDMLDVEVDLRVGGAYKIRMRVEGEPRTAHGVYREIEAPSRLVYTWDWEEGPMGETVVEVEFAEVGKGTEVRLTHSGFPAPEAKEQHAMGWTSCVDKFEALFA